MKRTRHPLHRTRTAAALLLAVFLLLSACGESGTVLSAQSGAFAPGVYRSSARGNNGSITVEAEFSADRILSVEVVEHSETAVLSDYAVKSIPAAIVGGQTLAVDAVSGVTETSNAILQAAAGCAAQAGGDLEVLQEPKEDAGARGESVALSADVVVVGAGFSGLCASIAALEQGAEVILIEKLAITGGSVVSSRGKFLTCETPQNREYHLWGQTISLSTALNKWEQAMQIATPSGFPDYERVGRMLTESMKALCWLKEQGIVFENDGLSPELGLGYAQADAAGQSSGEKSAGRMVRRLEERFLELGGVLLTQTAGEELIVTGAGVQGVLASGKNRDFCLSAPRVILACGGFGANEEWVAQFVPRLAEVGYVYQGVVSDEGDGVKMALQAGAQAYPDPWVGYSYITPHLELLEAHSGFLLFLEYNGLDDPESSYDRMMVDCTGRRLMNEAAFYSEQNEIMRTSGRGPYYVLYDGMDPGVCEILDAGLSTGRVFRGDTLEELAEAAGMEPEVLRAEAERYDSAARRGEDPDFGKDPARLHPIAEEGPYYLVEFVCCITTTYGGVVCDDYFRVLNDAGQPIGGLYAVGQMANRPYYSYGCVRASNLTFCAVMATVAGTHAATGAYSYLLPFAGGAGGK